MIRSPITAPVRSVTRSPIRGAGSDPAGIPAEFILQMQTTTASETITLPMTSAVNTEVDWGDGTTETYTTDNPTHTFATAGVYDIKITGSCGTFGFNNSASAPKLLAVLNGGTAFTAGEFNNAFFGCTNLVTADFTGLDSSGVTSMGSMFQSCTSLTSLDVSGFNTANVTSMGSMFRSCNGLTSDPGIHAFNVTSLTNATSMCLGSNNMLSTAEYNTILANWEDQAVNDNVEVHFGNATHSGDGTIARAALTLPVLDGGPGWTITDGGPAA